MISISGRYMTRTNLQTIKHVVRPKKKCVSGYPTHPFFSAKFRTLNLFLTISENFRKTTCFFRNRLFYYKIVMAAHLLATTSLLAVRINKCQHLVVDKNAIICIENCLYTFVIPFNIHWNANLPFFKEKNKQKNTYLPYFKIPCNRKHISFLAYISHWDWPEYWCL